MKLFTLSVKLPHFWESFQKVCASASVMLVDKQIEIYHGRLHIDSLSRIGRLSDILY
jgi:hypothetical protein